MNLRNAFGYRTRRRLLSAGRRHDLAFLAGLYHTDKHPAQGHNYAAHYQRHFAPLRRSARVVVEIGVGGYENTKGGGSSLWLWEDYFPQARIYGIDLYDKSWLNRGRVKTFQGDQADVDFLRRVVEQTGPPDIVIDDGSHKNAHVITSFRVLFPALKDGGIYAIEDLQTSYWVDVAGVEWGGSPDLRAPHTSMAFLKSLADGLNYQEFVGDYEPNYFDKHVTSLHFYHNLAFVHKGLNDEPGSFLQGRAPRPSLYG